MCIRCPLSKAASAQHPHHCTNGRMGTYSLEIVEGPRQVRSSGFNSPIAGRSMDPVPVLRLTYIDEHGNTTTDGNLLTEALHFLVHVRLYSGDGAQDLTDMIVFQNKTKPGLSDTSPDPFQGETDSWTHTQPSPSSASLCRSTTPAEQRLPDGSALKTEEPPTALSASMVAAIINSYGNFPPSAVGPCIQQEHGAYGLPLYGTLVSPSYFARGLDEQLSVFFLFGNLCTRIEGTFRLGFVLVDMRLSSLPPAPKTLCTVVSKPFVSHTWRTFPGMNKVSALTSHLITQGVVKIIRKAQPLKEERQKRWDYHPSSDSGKR
ncbi:velvet factor [Polychytrium aggregatum]|uniref:velvet factor n=1 Tax=Polychytrium aggregatum TaxID=110093 RepID=UPI0022FDE35E|nr:velvet factor [Polychytrium aggregatum]KAI9206924.1 velvet factor [Polychytrium aggregatum]